MVVVSLIVITPACLLPVFELRCSPPELSMVDKIKMNDIQYRALDATVIFLEAV
jgi:hypothetical protein